MMKRNSEGEVLEITWLSDVVLQFKLHYSKSNQFIPGQFIMLDLPIDAEFTTRSYSIASMPNNEQWIELCIVRKPDGPGTDFLFDQVKPGDILSVSEPQGKFQLTDAEVPVCMVCTGTGVAPFRSMIQNLITSYGRLPQSITLVFGNRFAKDILYREEWLELAENDAKFTFIPVLSREKEWAGAKGYVHDQYLPLAKENANMHFYLCGWTNMVREAKNKLKELGFSRKQLKFELYD